MRSKTQCGFSLVELMVASALFMTVVAVAAGSFISVLDASRDSQEFAELMNNVDFALEDMSRNMRVGENYASNGSLSSGTDSITLNIIEDSSECEISYQLNSSTGRIEKRKDSSCGGYDYLPITSDQIEITDLTFTGDQVGVPGEQPRVVINIAGQTEGDMTQTFNLQTSVTQRALNY